ncbi:hypothetical protein WA026_006761 [Henosepilachna vigintioctopunctata]|uniref:Helix-turn-helix domain-containing protein n=1 Tax=Henosepilachna vigintioctopunctata TaxID=420089 RepID=A0AAW1U7W5_9CUCU
MRIIRNGTLLKTDWHRKPMAADRFINFRLDHQIKMKINVVLNMKARVAMVSHPDYLDHNLKRLHEIMLETEYPKKLRKKLFCNTPYQMQPQDHLIASEDHS